MDSAGCGFRSPRARPDPSAGALRTWARLFGVRTGARNGLSLERRGLPAPEGLVCAWYTRWAIRCPGPAGIPLSLSDSVAFLL